eukprot:TRINITY_DN3354_c1_g1_i1.p1 TRINITY_DN3354_c1_g1~~TRINITY_DN3354_c1_g1_i1.p1  ORF type:complete len:1075 (-),score=135.44 TRINITY_DN3354_c1_g1_i1:9-3233(-)
MRKGGWSVMAVAQLVAIMLLASAGAVLPLPSASTSASIPPPPPDVKPRWPMFAHDEQRTGNNPDATWTPKSADDHAYLLGQSDNVPQHLLLQQLTSFHYFYALQRPEISNTTPVVYQPTGWKIYAKYQTLQMGSAPLIGFNGNIYISFTDVNKDAQIAAFARPAQVQQGSLWQPLWYQIMGSLTMSGTPSLTKAGRLIIPGPGYVMAVNALAAGATLWQQPFNATRSSPLAYLHPRLNQSVIYIGNQQGQVCAMEEENGTIVWTYTDSSSTGSIIASPALTYGGDVIVGSCGGYLYCLDGANGSLKWKFNTNHWIQDTATIDKSGNIYFPAWDRNVYCLSANGTRLWSQTMETPIKTPLAIHEEKNMVIFPMGSMLFVLDKRTGSTLWSKNLSASIVSSVSTDKAGRIFVGCADNSLNVFEYNGKQVWMTMLDSPITSPAALGTNRLYISSAGSLYAFGPTFDTDDEDGWLSEYTIIVAVCGSVALVVCIVAGLLGVVYLRYRRNRKHISFEPRESANYSESAYYSNNNKPMMSAGSSWWRPWRQTATYYSYTGSVTRGGDRDRDRFSSGTNESSTDSERLVVGSSSSINSRYGSAAVSSKTNSSNSNKSKNNKKHKNPSSHKSKDRDSPSRSVPSREPSKAQPRGRAIIDKTSRSLATPRQHSMAPDGSSIYSTSFDKGQMMQAQLLLDDLTAYGSDTTFEIAKEWEAVMNRACKEKWFIPVKELKLERRIAVGGVGTVYKARWRAVDVAVKVLTSGYLPIGISDNISHDRSIEEFIREIRLLATLRHPNVVMFLGATVIPTGGLGYGIVTEFCSRGSLWDVLHNTTVVFDWSIVLRLAHGIALGMHYLHSHTVPILHRDLKSPNVLVLSDYTPRITDFGLSKFRLDDVAKKTHTAAVGSPIWMPPEMMQGARCTEKADVYSFGVILWEILTRDQPYACVTLFQIYAMVIAGERLQIPGWAPATYASLIDACWAPDPSARPDFEAILESLSRCQDDAPQVPLPAAVAYEGDDSSGGVYRPSANTTTTTPTTTTTAAGSQSSAYSSGRDGASGGEADVDVSSDSDGKQAKKKHV